jgi:hypothetical protein
MKLVNIIWNIRTIKILAGIIIYFYALGLITIWANCDRGRPYDITNYPIIYDKFPESDFLLYWAASELTLEGNAREAYYPDRLFQVEATVIHPQHRRTLIYPPPYLLICLPLALVPFLPSLFLWGTATLAGFVTVIRRIAPHPLTVWLILAFPACFHTLVRGQNTFLSGILLGGGLLCLDYRPLTAGLLFGVMVYKPQLAVLIPVAMLVGRHWRALAGFVLSALGMILLSAALFGVETWSLAFQTLLLESQKTTQIPGFFPLNLNPTIFAFAKLMGLSQRMALGVHWTVAFLAAVAALWTWYQRAPLRIRASTLILATLLFPPRLFIYDFALLAIPLAFLGLELVQSGFTPVRAAIFVATFFMPFYAPILAANTSIQIGAWVVLVFIFAVMYDFYKDQPQTLSSPPRAPEFGVREEDTGGYQDGGPTVS